MMKFKKSLENTYAFIHIVSLKYSQIFLTEITAATQVTPSHNKCMSACAGRCVVVCVCV